MRVLILEDEMLLQMQMQMLIEDLGFDVEGPYATVAKAMEALNAGAVDCGLLDVNLRGEQAWPVAALLAETGTPFALTSGSSAADLEPRFANRPVFVKPVDEAKIRKFLTDVAREISAG